MFLKRTLITFFCFSFLMVPFGAKADGGESAYDRVLKTNTLRCAYASTAPNIYKDLNSGAIEGPVADIATAMADALNLKIDWVAEVGYADFAEGLKTGRYDAFCGILALAPQRARVVTFTNPTYYVPYFAYVRADETRLNALTDADRPEITAGTIDGEVFQMMTHKHFPNAKEHSLPNMTSSSEIFLDLLNKKSDIVIHDPLLALQHDRNNPGQIKQVFDKPVEVYPIGYAVAPEEQKLRDMLNAAILGLHNLGTIDDILSRYGVSGRTYYPVAKSYTVVK